MAKYKCTGGGITVLSLFDGMSCGQIALGRAGVEVSRYYASEVDTYAIKVAQANYPRTEQLGDVTKWREWDVSWASIDLLIGGSPCQGFSFAGKQQAFNDPRSALFFAYVDILNHIRKVNPTVKFLLENVKMKKAHIDTISAHLGVTPTLINSALVSAQNRKRLYWANWEFEAPHDLDIKWSSVRQFGVNEFYYSEKGMQWLGRSSRKKNKTLDVWADDDKAQMVEASHAKNYSNQRFFGICDVPSNQRVLADLRGRYVGDKNTTNETNTQLVSFRFDKKSCSVITVHEGGDVIPFTLPYRVPSDRFFFRYITPIECERLQTIPDDYTNHVSNTQRYKMLGNGWTVNVISHILSTLPPVISTPTVKNT